MISRNLEDEPMTKRRLMPATIVVSLLLHGAAYASLHAPAELEKPQRPRSQVRFDVVSRPEPKPPEPPKPELEPEPPKPEPKAKPRAAAPEPRPVLPETPPPAPTPETPPSTGVTLAGDGPGNAFSMPLGNGGGLDPTARPQAPAPVNVPAPTRPAPSPVRSEPPLVPVGDLSTKPSPPSLASALERNYPPDARRRGLSGAAKVRARIDADGVVRRVTLVEESAAGFGAACSRTLTGSRWAAPKDKAGRSVATEIRYTCRFVVEP
jgi:TonB family protein